MKHIAAPDPVEASSGLRDARAIALAKRQPFRVEPAAHQSSGGLDSLFFRLDADHVAAVADGFGQPQAVEPDAAAHVEAARAWRQAEIVDDPAGLRLLKAVHPLERFPGRLGFSTLLGAAVVMGAAVLVGVGHGGSLAQSLALHQGLS
jgi:hypothetical protein